MSNEADLIAMRASELVKDSNDLKVPIVVLIGYPGESRVKVIDNISGIPTTTNRPLAQMFRERFDEVFKAELEM